MNDLDFGQILSAKRKEKNLTQPTLSALLAEQGFDVKTPSLSKWEKNVNSPNVHQFFALCEVLGIYDINDTFHVANEDNPLSKLNPEGKEKVYEYANLLIMSGLYAPAEVIDITSRRLRVYDQPASAGPGQFLDSDRYLEVEVGNEVSPRADFGIRISGDSMEPIYQNGQIVWVHRQEYLSEGEIGIFYLDGEAFIKKFHRTEHGAELISLNKNYAPITIPAGSEFRTFGKVID